MDRSRGSRATRPVLIVGNPPRVSYAVLRSLSRHRIPVVVAAASDGEGPLWSMFARANLQLPDAKADPSAFDAALLDAIARTNADLLAPCSDAALAAIARADAAIRALADPGSPPPHVVERVLDKRLTLEAARSCGIAVPESFDLAASSAIPAGAFPLIAKARSQSRRGGVRLLRLESRAVLDEAMRLDPGFAERYVVQRYVDGHGEGVAVLMHAGAPLAVFQHRRIKELPASGGVSVVSESAAPEPALVQAAVSLLQTIAWEGVAQVEFRRGEDGTPWLMEINGRYWGSLGTAIAAGVDFPYYRWQIAHGEVPQVPDRYRVGVRVRWTRGAIMRLREVLFDRTLRPAKRRSAVAEAASFAGDFVPTTHSAMAAPIDPLPAWIDAAPAVGKLTASALRAAAFALVPRPLRRAYRRFGFGGMLDFARYALRANRRDRRGEHLMDYRSGSIVFVCSGNIMRSPLAAAAFEKAVAEAGAHGLVVESCGLHATDGTAAEPRAVAAAKAAGVDLSAHRAKRITAALIERAAAIVVMERFQAFELLRDFPQARPKLFLLGEWVAGYPVTDFADPYLESDAETARLLGLVAARAQALGKQIAAAVTSPADDGGAKGATGPGGA